ncbi:MAG: S41 family peptidase [Gemmatimonadetes bacterium]|nr:S41 family peptidase [Gemmatimonadota bacterium]
MRIKRSFLAPAIVALIALATGGWFLQQGASQDRNVYFQARLFEEVLHHISDRYVDQKDPASLYRMAIDGLLQELGDPHTVFMEPKDYEHLRVQTQGEYGGLGIEIDVRDGWVTVISPLPGTPAERVGLQAGDRIIDVDGTSTKGWTADDAVLRLRGPKGAPVNIKVARFGVDEPIPFRIVRDEIHVKSIRSAYIMDGGVGYIELRVFSETSTDELRAEINALRKEGMRGLVLDLRRNPGGLLDQGVSVSDVFLSRGLTVAETRSRVPSQNQKFSAIDGDEYPGLPIVVLVGPGSASASEILAGALQDHDRALIMGETSFGKGSVQTLYPLPAGNYLKLTTARWFTPAGRSIQRPYDERAESEPTPAVVCPPEEQCAAPSRQDTYRTDSGRTVYGGGGIRPDLIIKPDTLTDNEQAFARSVQKYGSKFADAIYGYAIRYVRQHPDLKPGFPLTPDAVDGFYQALIDAGIAVDRAQYGSATRWLGRELAYQISYARWGEEEARKRFGQNDPQLALAVELLRQAHDPKSLIALAARYETERGSAAKGSAQAAKKTAASGRRP